MFNGNACKCQSSTNMWDEQNVLDKMFLYSLIFYGISNFIYGAIDQSYGFNFCNYTILWSFVLLPCYIIPIDVKNFNELP